MKSEHCGGEDDEIDNGRLNHDHVIKEGPMTLAGDGQDGRCFFSLVEEDGCLIGCLEFSLGGAW